MYGAKSTSRDQDRTLEQWLKPGAWAKRRGRCSGPMRRGFRPTFLGQIIMVRASEHQRLKPGAWAKRHGSCSDPKRRGFRPPLLGRSSSPGRTVFNGSNPAPGESSGQLFLFGFLLRLLVEFDLRLGHRLINPFQVGHRRRITLP